MQEFAWWSVKSRDTMLLEVIDSRETRYKDTAHL